MTLAEMERKLESLEKRVQELETRRPWDIHYHSHEAPNQPVEPVQPPFYVIT